MGEQTSKQRRRSFGRDRGTGVGTLVLGGLVCAGLVGGVVSPVWAAEPPTPDGSAVVGGFGLGDGLEAMVDERDGAVQFGLSAGAVQLSWDSRRAGADRHGFGPGWGIGLAGVDTDGGVRVYPTSGGVFEVDASHPSGLRGYGTHDVTFRTAPGVLPARDGVTGAVEYEYVLRELGGTTTYFTTAGDPVERVSATGQRTRWEWDAALPHRLLAAVDTDGVRTELDWSDTGTIIVRAGANLGTGTTQWRIEVGDTGITVTDPVGQLTAATHDTDGHVSRIDAPSGASTEVTWVHPDDSAPNVDMIRTLDLDGSELSVRRWARSGAAGPSGWPAADVALGMSPAEYETVLTDDATRVISSYNAQHLLTKRRTEISTPSGTQVVQDTAFGYPEVTGPLPSDLPAQFNRPTTTEITHHDATGRTRTVTEALTFDELGRMTTRTAADGSITTTSYDTTVPVTDPAGETSGVPIGLPLTERTTAADGLITETRHQLNDAHTAVTATETFTGPAEAQLVRTGRTEYTVEPDGFVSAERMFPQGGAGDPLVTERDRTVDLTAGTVTTTETVAVGTTAAATVASVASLVHGQVLEETSAAGVSTSAAYDEIGRVTEQTDARGNVTTIDYETAADDGRTATVVTSPAAEGTTPKVTVEERDALGRVIRTTDNLNDGEPTDGHTRVIETRDYLGAGTIAVTDAWGATTTTTKDALDRVVSTTAPTGLTEVTVYNDIAGTKTTGVTTTGDLADAELTRTETIDAHGRTTATTGTRADGAAVAATSVEYDGLGRAVQSTTEDTTTTVQPDAFGNPVTTTVTPTQPASTDTAGVDSPADTTLTAVRRFDEHGTSQAKTLTVGAESRTGRATTHDALGRKLTETDQHDQTTTSTYSADGLVTRVAYPDGRVTVNEYDPQTRALILTSTTHPNGATVATATTYDPITGAVTEVYDPANPADTTIRYAHDGHGNLTTVTYPDGNTIQHAYDQHGRKTATTDIAGNVTMFEYTDAGLLTGAVQHDPNGTELARVEYRHDQLGRVDQITRGNDVITTIDYTSANEIAAETTRHGDDLQSERTYTYDTDGTLTARTDTIHHDDGAPTVTTTAYEYDHLNRLTASTIHDGDSTDAPATTRTDYALNVSGDLTEESVIQAPGTAKEQTTTRRFSYETTGELTAIATIAPDGSTTIAAQTYDPAGNLTAAHDGTTYTYDPLNRPISQTTPEGEKIATGYWADGSRKSLRTTTADGSSSTTGFYWAGDTLINDTHTADGDTAGDRTGTAAYLLAGTREARTTVDQTGDLATSYSTHDRHQNITELTDIHGAVTTRYDYTDYGVTTESPVSGFEPAVCGLTRNPFQYAGEQTDCSGTQHLRARTYDPITARFTTLDPTPLHNRYAYADTNPITNIDPSGHIATTDLVNYLTIGVTVAFAAFTIGTAIWSGGLSVGLGGAAATVLRGASWQWRAATVLNAAGATADVLGALTATTLVINDHMPDFGAQTFLPGSAREHLGYLDYALAGAGLLGAASTVPYVLLVRGSNRESRAFERANRYLEERLTSTGGFLEHSLLKVHARQTNEGYTKTGLYKSLLGAVHTFERAHLALSDTVEPVAAWLKTYGPRLNEAEAAIAAARSTLKTEIDAGGLAEDVKIMAHFTVDEMLFELGPKSHAKVKSWLARKEYSAPAGQAVPADTVISDT